MCGNSKFETCMLYWGWKQRGKHGAAGPEQMILMDVPENEYIVFEHGPFDFETESASVEAKIEASMKAFDYSADGY